MSDTTLNGIPARRADAVTAPINEDWLAVVLGLAIFVLALAALTAVAAVAAVGSGSRTAWWAVAGLIVCTLRVRSGV